MDGRGCCEAPGSMGGGREGARGRPEECRGKVEDVRSFKERAWVMVKRRPRRPVYQQRSRRRSNFPFRLSRFELQYDDDDLDTGCNRLLSKERERTTFHSFFPFPPPSLR